MPTYEFSCDDGCSGLLFTSQSTQVAECPVGHPGPRRRYTFAGFHRKWSGGYSPTTGGYAANEHEVSEKLKAASEAQSEATGMEHRYKPIDPREALNNAPARPAPKRVDVDKIAAEISRAMG